MPPLAGQLYLRNILEFGLWIEGQEWYELDSQNGEKMSLNASRGFLESYILGQQVFSAEKNEKAMPSGTGQVDLHFVGRISPAKQDEK